MSGQQYPNMTLELLFFFPQKKNKESRIEVYGVDGIMRGWPTITNVPYPLIKNSEKYIFFFKKNSGLVIKSKIAVSTPYRRTRFPR